MADMDMDLDDLDVPKQAPTRPAGKFAPKGSKFQPKPKPKPKPKTETPPSNAKDDSDSKPPLNDTVATSNAKDESDSKPQLNDAVPMDSDDKAQEEDTNAAAINMEDDKEEDEEEDYVTKEIDVYFNPSIGDDTKIYVLQYPLRPVYRPYNSDDRCQEVRVKPSTNEVEVDLKIDLSSKNYDRNADPTRRITKETLITKWKPSARPGYAIGLLTGDTLHLNPIHALVQLRPSLEHNNVKKNVEDPVKKDVEQKQSMGTSQDQWVPLKCHGEGSVISDKYLEKMMKKGDSQIQFSMSSSNYLDILCSIPLANNPKSNVPSKRSLLSLSLDERYKRWLVQGATVHRFDTLKHYLNPGESVADLLEVLQKHGRLVQGLWVPKSTLMEVEKDKQLHEIARDFVLSQFSQSRFISETHIPQSPAQLFNAIKNALNGFAIKRPTLNDWKFKELPDTAFIKLHLQIAEEQQIYWEGRAKEIHNFIQGKTAGVKSFKKVASKT